MGRFRFPTPWLMTKVGISKAVTAKISVAAVNDAPVVDLNGSATGSSTTLSYSLGNSATKIAANAIVTDVDNTTFGGGALNVAVTANGSSTDQLSIVTDSVVKVINASVFVNNAKVGSILAGHNGANGTDLSIALANGATPAALTTLIEHLGYSSSLLTAPSSSRVVTFTVTDGNGTASGGSDTGFATATINLIGIGTNQAPTGTVAISGSATEDQTLTASNTLADLDGLGAISYHWQRDTGSGFVNISGASASTYQLGDADVGATVRVVASYTDAKGTSESVASGATAPIANVNDAPTGTVAISGSATEDQTLTASNTLADLDGLGAISYHWQRDTGSGFVNISGASASAYQLGDADVGATVRVVASYTDAKGTSESVASGRPRRLPMSTMRRLAGGDQWQCHGRPNPDGLEYAC